LITSRATAAGLRASFFTTGFGFAVDDLAVAAVAAAGLAAAGLAAAVGFTLAGGAGFFFLALLGRGLGACMAILAD
jgi:hypothetical protein